LDPVACRSAAHFDKFCKLYGAACVMLSGTCHATRHAGAYVYDYDEEANLPRDMAAATLPVREVTVPCITIKPGQLFSFHPYGCAWVLKQAVANNMKVHAEPHGLPTST
jgi:hypothetical protein